MIRNYTIQLVVLFCCLVVANPGTTQAQIKQQKTISKNAQSLGDQTSHCPALSGDGRYTIFESFASNLAANDSNQRSDLFLYDSQTDSSRLLSQNSQGIVQQGGENPTTCSSAISRDGSTSIYATDGYGLVGSFQTNISRLYAINNLTGEIELLTPPDLDEGVFFPSVSQDGSKIVFVSNSKLIDPKATGDFQVYLLERPTNRITLLSTDSLGQAANGDSIRAEISHDGYTVVFDSKATDLKGAEFSPSNISFQVFKLNLQTSETTLISKNSLGIAGNSDSLGAHTTEDGRQVVFFTSASNLISGQKKNSGDVLLYDSGVTGLELISVSSEGKRLAGFHELLGNVISADGNLVMFRSLIGSFEKFRIEVYVRDRKNARTYLSSFSNGCSFGTSGGSSHSGSISPDAKKLSFAIGKETAKSFLQLALVDLDVLHNIDTAPSSLDPVDVDVCSTKVTLALSPYALSTESFSLLPLELPFIEAKAGVSGVSYETRIRRNESKTDVLRLVSKRNLLSLSNLKPGNYSATYRVTVRNSSGVETKSRFSSATKFRIKN